jgi:hypothetical protein
MSAIPKQIAAILLIQIIFSAVFFSQTRDEQIQKGINYIYNLKYDSANVLFGNFIANEPQDPTGYFFQAMTEWWKIYLNKDDESNDENYLSKVDKCIKICEERIDKNENDDLALFMMGGIIGYRGFLNSMRDNWLKAVDDRRQGLSLIQRSYELNPGNIDAVFGIGLYNYAADYVTERYTFLKPLLLFFPQGNKELGLKQLKECAEKGRYSRTEANAVLCFLNLNYEKNYIEAEKHSSFLHTLYPENPVFEKFLGRSYVGQGKWTESLNVWSSVGMKIDSGKTGYTSKQINREYLYYTGLTQFKLSNHDDAISKYEKSLVLSIELDKKGESAFQVFSALGLGMIHDIKGNRKEALRYYNMVLEMRDIENSHSSAKMFIEKAYR